MIHQQNSWSSCTGLGSIDAQSPVLLRFLLRTVVMEQRTAGDLPWIDARKVFNSCAVFQHAWSVSETRTRNHPVFSITDRWDICPSPQTQNAVRIFRDLSDTETKAHMTVWLSHVNLVNVSCFVRWRYMELLEE